MLNPMTLFDMIINCCAKVILSFLIYGNAREKIDGLLGKMCIFGKNDVIRAPFVLLSLAKGCF